MTPRLARALPLLVLSATLALSACLDDTPVAPTSQSAVALRVSLQAAPIAGQSMHVQVVSFDELRRRPISLFDDTLQLTSGEQSVRASFDLTPCLSAFTPDSLGPYCIIQVEAQLIADGTVLDDRLSSPIYARPGESVDTPQMYLVAGNTAPELASVDTAVLVVPGLIKFRVTGSDGDNDLLTVTESLFDGQGLFVGASSSTLPLPVGSYHGEFFGFVPSATAPQTMQVNLVDSKGNLSQPDTVTLVPATDLIVMTGIATDTTTDSVHVSLQLLDPSQSADSVQVVFRNVVDDVTSFTDSLYFVCAAKFDPTAASPTVGCERTVPFTRAIAIALPITPAGDWGIGASCSVPGSCIRTFRRTRE